jgi:hypothetical protein
MHTFAALNQMPETKGTTLYDINEKACLLCVSQKHKLKIFQWQSGLGGFLLRREVSYPESPRTLLCISGTNNLLVGLKKHYEILDLQSYNSTKVVEFEKEHRLVAFEVSSFHHPFDHSKDSCDIFTKSTSCYPIYW